MYRNRIIWFSVFAICIAAAAPTGAASIGRHESKVVAVSQTVSSPSSGVQSTITVDLGMAAQVRGALSLSKGSARLSDQGGLQFAGLPAVNYSSQQKTV